MALIKCPDCEQDVSTRAVSCPKCGCVIAATEASQPTKPHVAVTQPAVKKGKSPKNRSKMGWGGKIIGIGIFFFIYGAPGLFLSDPDPDVYVPVGKEWDDMTESEKHVTFNERSGNAITLGIVLVVIGLMWIATKKMIVKVITKIKGSESNK